MTRFFGPASENSARQEFPALDCWSRQGAEGLQAVASARAPGPRGLARFGEIRWRNPPDRSETLADGNPPQIPGGVMISTLVSKWWKKEFVHPQWRHWCSRSQFMGFNWCQVVRVESFYMGFMGSDGWKRCMRGLLPPAVTMAIPHDS